MSATNEKKSTVVPLDKSAFNEKSKHAVRERRKRENAQLSELQNLLPLPSNTTKNLDKASVVKLTTSYLKMKDVLFEDGRFRPIFRDDVGLPFNFIESSDGFLMILGHDGKMAYISETVTQHLGLAQLELMGSNIYDYTHAADHDELMGILTQHIRTRRSEHLEAKRFLLRMRCILAKRNAGLTHGLFKVIHFNGHLKMNARGKITLLAIGKCLPSSPTTRITLNKKMFMFRTGLDLKMSYLDECIGCVGYKPQELMDKSLYEYIHVYDIHSLRYSHHQLLTKGQTTSKYYRFLCKFGGYLWLQSEMSVVYKFKGKPHCIVAVNHILSGAEQANLVLSQTQEKNSMEIGDFRCREFENPLLPTTIIIEDNTSEVSSSNYSHSSEVCVRTNFLYEAHDGRGDFLNFPPHQWEQQHSYCYEIN